MTRNCVIGSPQPSAAQRRQIHFGAPEGQKNISVAAAFPVPGALSGRSEERQFLFGSVSAKRALLGSRVEGAEPGNGWNLPGERSVGQSEGNPPPALLRGTSLTDLLRILRAAAREHDAVLFSAVCDSIPWGEVPVGVVKEAVKLALEAAALLSARSLSELGSRRFPEEAELVQLCRIMSPPARIILEASPTTGIQANRESLKRLRSALRGRWVALRNGALIGDAPTLAELTQMIAPSKDVLFTRVS
jgi:hypothetical protein